MATEPSSVEKTKVADTPPVRPEFATSPEELNPLLNPLLEQNLARWAQVYFTTPPAARDQAVRDLLRQLRANVGSSGTPSPAPTTDAVAPAAASVSCSNCRGENAPYQQFCGFCGILLDREKAADVAPPQPEWAAPARELPRVETLSFLGLDSSQANNEMESLRERSFGSAYYEADSAPSRRGRYAIAAIVIILAGLTYLEWPSLRSHLQSASQPAPAVQAPAVLGSGSPLSVVPAQSEPQQSASHEARPQAAGPPEPAPPPEPLPSTPEDAASHRINNPEHPVQPSQPLTMASHRETIAAVPDGTQELLQAQRYLDGRGVAHDSVQAAAWLWKAVSKQNSRADVLLADLYLRGDGVPKSCVQARLLLVAAAKKSAPGAAERLRSLEARGCR